MRTPPDSPRPRPRQRPLLTLALAGPLLACSGSIGIEDNPSGSVNEPGPGPTNRPPGTTPGTGGPSTGGPSTTPGTGGAPGTTPGSRPTEPGPSASGECKTEAPGLPSLRRLTTEELERSLKALLGRDVAVAWPQDEAVVGYPSARGNFVLEPHARSLYTTLLPELRRIVTSSPTALSDACATTDTKCATALAEKFAVRAWRRPVSAEERTSLLAFYDQVLKELGGDAKEATATLVLSILSSPHFLYRSEVGVADAKADAPRRLSSREVGTALSYFFLGQPPDAMLLTKIESNSLQTEAQILAEIERLRGSPAHAAWMARFFQQWTHVQDLEDKDHALDKFPDATKAYKKEAEEAFVRQVTALMGKPNATFEELVAGKSFVAGPLTAKVYKPGAKPTGFQTFEAEDGRRGLFTSVAFLSQYSKPDRPNAIERAKFFLDQVICRELPGIPADALQREFMPDPKKSPRQNFEVLTSDAACAGCHMMLNPIGFSFDKYGPDGQLLRAIEGFPVDTKGSVRGTTDIDGDIDGPEDLIAKVAKSREARMCFIKQWFRFSNGRQESALDACTLQRLFDTMEKEGDSLTTFARHYFTSRNFLYRHAQEAP
jgi:hypothetical protein